MQVTKNILLVRPSNFIFNHETASSNAFQNIVHDRKDSIKENVLNEFESFVAKLKSKGVNVFVVNDTHYSQKPDAVFPNNWVTFHEDGRVILYPMFASNRRYERRQDIIDTIKNNFVVKEVIDLSYHEIENRYLEGTGSIIFDHVNNMAYACLSPRTDKDLFIYVCNLLSYQPIFFSSCDKGGKEVYHTNVMMCIAEKFSVICLESIPDLRGREIVSKSLQKTGHQIIEITFDQMKNFAGNMLSLRTEDEKDILVLSQSAFDSLTSKQRKEIEKYCELFPLSIKKIETIGGGSARCMIAEIFLKEVSHERSLELMRGLTS